jgi:chromosome segregation ATPase
VLEESGGQIAQATKTASDGIQEALSTFSNHARALNAVSRRQVEAAEKLVERIEAIDVPTNLIERTLAPALEEIVTHAKTKVAEIETKVSEGQAAILGMQSVTVEDLKARVARQIEEFEGQLRELRETGANGIVGSMRALADRQAEAFSQIARQAEATLIPLQQSRQAMEQEADRARAATVEVMQQLKSMVQTLAHELGGSRAQPHRLE